MKNLHKKFILLSLIILSQAKLHSMLGTLNKLKVFSKTKLLLQPKINLNSLKKFSNSKDPNNKTSNPEIIDTDQILKDLKKFAPFYVDKSINYLPILSDAEILNRILNNTEKSFSTTDAQMLNIVYQLTKRLDKQEKDLERIKFLAKRIEDDLGEKIAWEKKRFFKQEDEKEKALKKIEDLLQKVLERKKSDEF